MQRDPFVEIDRLAMLTSADAELIEHVQAPAPIVYPQVPVYQLILEHGRTSPQRPAVSFGTSTLTYGELARRSSALAMRLRSDGIGAGDVVAICMPPCVEFLIALLAVWQAGAVYCPLDPTHPEAYRQHMLALAEPRLVLLHGSLAHMPGLEACSRVMVDELRAEAAEAVHVETGITLDSPAYQFFTSGTTGKPKGVLASHRNLAHYIHVAQQTFSFGAEDVFVSIARYTFSISLFELVSPLCVGAQLLLTQRHDVLDPERLLQLLNSVTVPHAGPSLLTAFFRFLRSNPELPQTLPHLRHVSSGGDIVTASVMEDMKRVFPQAEIFVLYGSTEISCMGTYYPVSREETQTKSLVGHCFPGVQLCVLDQRLQQQALGVVGDIWFAGAGVALGYHRQPELENGKFVDISGNRFCKMGDVGRLAASGELENVGSQ